MTDAVISFDKSFSLSSLQAVLRNEEGNGELTDLDHTADFTIGVYADKDPPTAPVNLLTTVGGQAVLPNGATLICTGTVWITGQLQNVVAYRQ